MQTAVLTLLLSLAGNAGAPGTPQARAEFGSGSEMVPPVWLQRGDGWNLTQNQPLPLLVKSTFIYFDLWI